LPRQIAETIPPELVPTQLLLGVWRLFTRGKEALDECIEADSKESVEVFIDEYCNKDLRAWSYAIRAIKAVPWVGGGPDYFIRFIRERQ